MSQIEHLTEQLDAARAALNAALSAGGDTTESRYQIGVIESEIAAIVRRQREERVEAEREQQAAIAAAAAELAEQAHTAVEAATEVPGLEDLAGETLAPVARDPQIDVAAAAVVRARATLVRAESECRPHAERVATLQQRIRDKLAAIDSVSARRIAGDERGGDAAELDMLRKDAGALDALLTDAKAAATAADQRPAARAALSAADQALSQAHNRVAYETAKERVRQVDLILVKLFGVMVETGRAAGKSSPWSEYQASPGLKRVVTGAIVPGFRGSF
ncbi:hypothetical protein ACLIKD_08905 [Azonexus sp. IMCC34842]|uniref:hypothetical protein n=1 Tax=Azonexus sp. IMCC34842 TaxID=3420950 RepID=UPI003D15267C